MFWASFLFLRFKNHLVQKCSWQLGAHVVSLNCIFVSHCDVKTEGSAGLSSWAPPPPITLGVLKGKEFIILISEPQHPEECSGWVRCQEYLWNWRLEVPQTFP